MSVVYEALDITLGRKVAIKLLKDEGDDRERIKNALDEARVLAAVNHRNIVQIYFIGKTKKHPYIVMELVDAGHLDNMISSGASPESQMNESAAIELMIDVAQGLKAAGDAGILHGDVKPSNILIDAKGVAKVIDFGIARSEKRIDQPTTLGTPYYIAPEILKKEEPDARADIYSLGITMYHVLVGKPPFSGETVKDVLKDRFTSPVPDVRTARPDIHPNTAAVLSRMVAFDPAERQQDYDQLIEDLYMALEQLSHVPTEPDELDHLHAALQDRPVDEEATERMASRSAGLVVKEPNPNVRKFAIIGGSAFAALLLVSFVAWALLSGSDPEPVDPQPGPIVKGPDNPPPPTPTPPDNGGEHTDNGDTGGGDIVPVKSGDVIDVNWVPLVPVAKSLSATNDMQLKAMKDNSVYAWSALSPKQSTYTIKATAKLQNVRSLQLELMLDESLPNRGPGHGPKGLVAISEFRVSVAPASKPNEKTALRFTGARAIHNQSRYPIGLAYDGNPATTWLMPGASGQGNKAIFVFRKPIEIREDAVYTIELDHQYTTLATTGRVRFSVSTQTPDLENDLPPLAAVQPKPEILGGYKRGIEYAYYPGGFQKMPDFSKMKPADTGVVEYPSLTPAKGERFAMRFTGKLLVDKPGKYTFTLGSDDGSLLFIDQQQIVDLNQKQAYTESSGSIDLSAGAHDIDVQFFNTWREMDLQLYWAGPGFGKQLIPLDRIFHGAMLRGPGRSGLIARWKFDELGGNVAKDHGDHGYDASVTGGTWSVGRMNTGLLLNEKSTVVVNESSAISLGQGDFSITAWVRTASEGGGAIISRSAKEGEWSDQSRALFVRDGKVGYEIAGAGDLVGKTKIKDRQWHHVALVYRHGTTQYDLYVDGAKDGGKRIDSKTLPPGHILRLGSVAPGLKGVSSMKGSIDDVRIYGRSISDDEIHALASGEMADTEGPPPAPDVIYIAQGGEWRYFDGPADAPSGEWQQPQYDDAKWKKAKSQFAYFGGKTKLDGKGKRITHYFRQKFNVIGEIKYPQLAIQGLIDDGAVVYLNGREVKRINMPDGSTTALMRASKRVFKPRWQTIAVEADDLRFGENVLAVELHQKAIESSDTTFDLQLTGTFRPKQVKPVKQPGVPAESEKGWRRLELVKLKSRISATLAELDDGSILVTRPSGQPPTPDTYTIVADTDLNKITAIRLEALPHPTLPKSGPGFGPDGKFVLSNLSVEAEQLVEGDDERKTLGRFVRVEGKGNIYMILAEVQVFSGDTNVATDGTATQVSDQHRGSADRAIDGKTNGNFRANSVTHTNRANPPWWEVDLGAMKLINRIVIWPRTDNNDFRYLEGARVTVLDDSRNVVFSETLTDVKPQPKRLVVTGPRPIRFSKASASFSTEMFQVENAIFDRNRRKMGWAVHPQTGKQHSAIFVANEPFGLATGTTLTIQLHQHFETPGTTLGRFRIMATTSPKPQGFAEPKPPPARESPQTFFNLIPKPKPESKVALADNKGWYALDIERADSNGKCNMVKLRDGSILVNGHGPHRDERYTLEATTDLRGITGIRLDCLADFSLPAKGPGRRAGQIVIQTVEVDASEIGNPQSRRTIKLVDPKASFEQHGQPARHLLDPNRGRVWAISPKFGEDHHVALRFDQPIDFEKGTRLSVRILHRDQETLGRFMISLTTAEDPHAVQTEPTINRPPAHRVAFEPLQIIEAKSTSGGAMKIEDGVVVPTGDATFDEDYSVTAKAPTGNISAFQLELLTEMKGPRTLGPGRLAGGKFYITGFKVTARPPNSTAAAADIQLVKARADMSNKGRPPQNMIEDNAKGWDGGGKIGSPRLVAFNVSSTANIKPGSLLTFTIKQKQPVGRFRIGFTTRTNPDEIRFPKSDEPKDPDTTIKPKEKLVYRVNLGGGDTTGPDGEKWIKCPNYTPGKFGVQGGQDINVDGVDKRRYPSVVYHRCRRDLKAVRFTVPKGRYRVSLVLIEPHKDKADQRIFDIDIEGQSDSVDVFRMTRAKGKPLLPFPRKIVTVKDGVLDVTFTNAKDASVLAGIIVEQLSVYR